MNVKDALDSRLPRAPLMVGRNSYYLLVCHYYERKNKLLHDGTGRWDNIQWLNPDEIQYITYNDHHLDYGHKNLNVGAFDIVKRSAARIGGKWDRTEVEFTELDIYRAVTDRVTRNVPWEETIYFRSMEESIRDNERPYGCASTAELRRRCEYIDNLVDSIRENGYCSQRSLGKVCVDEVTVNLGRDGSVLFNDGRHRLAIAKILGLDAIPVRILVTHEQYEGEPTLTDTDVSAPVVS